MAFTYKSKGKEYTLYTKEAELRGDRTQTIYFFSPGKPKSGEPTDKPSGYEVGVNQRSGLPFLKKK